MYFSGRIIAHHISRGMCKCTCMCVYVCVCVCVCVVLHESAWEQVFVGCLVLPFVFMSGPRCECVFALVCPVYMVIRLCFMCVFSHLYGILLVCVCACVCVCMYVLYVCVCVLLLRFI